MEREEIGSDQVEDVRKAEEMAYAHNTGEIMASLARQQAMELAGTNDIEVANRSGNPLVHQFLEQAAEYSKMASESGEKAADDYDMRKARILEMTGGIMKQVIEATQSIARGDTGRMSISVPIKNEDFENLGLPTSEAQKEYKRYICLSLGLDANQMAEARRMVAEERSVQQLFFPTKIPNVQLRYGRFSPSDEGYAFTIECDKPKSS
jgi:hypothetical protein